MNKLRAFLRLIRAGNLLFIILTQYLIRYFVVIPKFNYYSIEPTLSDGAYALLVLSTVLIAAAGYMVNDYFDVEADEVNKPDRVVVGKQFTDIQVTYGQMLFNVLGVLIGMGLSWHLGNYRLGMLFIVIVAFLWFYSMQLKKIALIGNLIIAGITAMVILLPGVYETMGFADKDNNFILAGGNVLYILRGYGLFAFVATLIREIIKDLQDEEGDRSVYANTLPIIAGITIAKLVTSLFILGFIGLLGYVQSLYYQEELTGQFAYIIGLQLLALFSTVYLWLANSRVQYGKLSSVWKFIILLGILSMAIFEYL